MPATYTYNEALEDAKRVVVDEWKHAFSEKDPEKYMRFVLDVIGRLDRLKRPSRQKRSKQVGTSPELDAALNHLLPHPQS